MTLWSRFQWPWTARTHRNRVAAAFDPFWYRATYLDVVPQQSDPIADYLKKGWRLGRDPHPLFDTRWYLERNPDVREAGVEPLSHFLADGWREGRNPHPLFDTDFYLLNNDEVRESGHNPWLHFLDHGWREGRDSHPLFAVRWYRERYPEVGAADVNPLVHYVTTGAPAGFDPHPDFDSARYLESLPDRTAASAQPLRHYLAGGRPAAPAGGRPRIVRTCADHLDHVVALAANAAASGDIQDSPAAGADAVGPLLSFVVPVFNTKPRYLDDLLASFLRQDSRLCELVLSDDGSTSQDTWSWLDRHRGAPGVVVLLGSENRGIAAATNRGIAAATGTWIGLLDHDDALAPFAGARIAEALRHHPECLFLYTDEVITDGRLKPRDYFLKPAWDPVLLSGVNYINHLSLYLKDRLLSLGGLRDGFQGSQDYDLLLRYTADLDPATIVHLPYPAYLWRRDGDSYSATFLESATQKARQALQEHHRRPDREISVGPALTSTLHRVRFGRPEASWPAVTVVIPSRNGLPLISRVLEGLTRTDYPDLDILVIDNGSDDPAVLALYEQYRTGPLRVEAVITPEAFNFSRSINKGVAQARGDLVLLLNNDVEVIDAGWLKEMVSCFDYAGTGVVGAKLLYPDRTLQHIGVIAGLSDLAGHWFTGRQARFPGPQSRLMVRQSLSIVTAACLLVSKACFAASGPFDETAFPIAYNDVDFCLRAVAAGFRIVMTPFATLIHHESASRGSDETPENQARFRRDKVRLRQRHRTDVIEDPAFNPWMSRHHADHLPVRRDELPRERTGRWAAEVTGATRP